MDGGCLRLREHYLCFHFQEPSSITKLQPSDLTASTALASIPTVTSKMQPIQQVPAMSNIPGLEIEKSRAGACWSNSDCKSCTHSKHGCGWCPYSSTCVPTSNLLKPIRDADICPLRAERFELRTKALGCGCSTTTLLSVLVTIFATIAGLVLLYGLVLALVQFNKVFGSGTFGGTEIEVEDDGTRKERQWRRSNAVTSYVRRTTLKATKESEQEQVTERSRLLG